MGPGIGNGGGHWESQSICDLNDALLNSAGSAWHDWTGFNQDWYASPEASEFSRLASSVLTEEFGGSSLFVLKDPRICRIAPFWLEVIEQAGIQPVVVLPIRNPAEVGASLEKRDGFPPELGHLLWLRHVLEAEAATRGRPRVHASFDSLLDDWEHLALRAAKAFGLLWPRDDRSSLDAVNGFLQKQHRHHWQNPESVLDNPMFNRWVRDTYEIFSRWSERDEDREDYALLDCIKAEFDTAAPMFRRLVAPGREVQGREEEMDSALSNHRDQIAGLEGKVRSMQIRVQDGEEALIELAAARAQTEEQTARIAELVAERDRLAEEGGQARGELAVKQELLGILDGTLVQRQEEITQAYAEIAEHKGQVDALNTAIAELVAERDRLTEAGEKSREDLAQAQDRLGSLENTLVQRQEEITQAYVEIAEHKGQVDALNTAIAELVAERDRLTEAGEKSREDLAQAQDRLGSLESTLAQRQEEITQAYAEIAEHKGQVDALNAAVAKAYEHGEAVRSKLAETEKWVFDLSAERRKIQTVATRLERSLLVSETQRLQAEAAHERELASATIRLNQAIEEKSAVEARLADRFQEIATLSGLLRDQEALANRLSAEARRLEGSLQSSETQRLQAEAAHERELASATIRLNQAIEEKSAVEARLADRFQEIATLSGLLRDQETLANRSSEDAKWLQEVASALINGKQSFKQRLVAFMPAALHAKRQRRLLKRQGLFDGEAYLAAHPDVAADGADPLLHYLLHGIKENRRKF
jgi:hypothetical protein